MRTFEYLQAPSEAAFRQVHLKSIARPGMHYYEPECTTLNVPECTTEDVPKRLSFLLLFFKK